MLSVALSSEQGVRFVQALMVVFSVLLFFSANGLKYHRGKTGCDDSDMAQAEVQEHEQTSGKFHYSADLCLLII